MTVDVYSVNADEKYYSMCVLFTHIYSHMKSDVDAGETSNGDVKTSTASSQQVSSSVSHAPGEGKSAWIEPIKTENKSRFVIIVANFWNRHVLVYVLTHTHPEHLYVYAGVLCLSDWVMC